MYKGVWYYEWIIWGNVEWFQCWFDMNMFLQIQLQSGVKRNAVWNDLRGSEQVDAMDVWFSVSLQMWARERKISWCCRNQHEPILCSKESGIILSAMTYSGFMGFWCCEAQIQKITNFLSLQPLGTIGHLHPKTSHNMRRVRMARRTAEPVVSFLSDSPESWPVQPSVSSLSSDSIPSLLQVSSEFEI